ncbi:type VI secretion system baseplate subunit TssF [Mangrovicoccus algicola]|uniref:Type VI secretion system baseplate subunit TssF n=1 Tax=Mangrovicoccus algicola TaxID=2771008 RepID=A0A8J6Z166_9RHOB|nr:type VI secretion system baseplate subunit TssF [Mangrovicoccus algicola]MBE3639606.1 type VI secretion system baseplate subunit TssF [Mangrovicoccus algicola]
MDSRLLRHYETELAYLREMGAEFAEAYPKIAGRLGMEGTEVLDPYVERLLEGSAFLAARVQLELELQYPAFAAHLFEIVHPQFLAPVPSMMVAQFVPDMENAALGDGHLLARGSRLTARPAEGSTTRCEFRTSQDVTLWPVRIAEAEYVEGRGALVAAGLALPGGPGQGARAAIRLRLERHGGAPLAGLSLDRLPLYVAGTEAAAWMLYELLANEVCAVAGRSADPQADWVQPLPAAAARPMGFAPGEALLPLPDRSFDGFRLIREYFAMPRRFRFLELQGLAPAIGRAAGSAVDIYLLLSHGNAAAEGMLRPETFAPYCSPAINLFERRCDRVQISRSDVEQHVVVDRTAPLDHEIHAVTSVKGFGSDGAAGTEFLPFFAAGGFTPLRAGGPAYYTQRRRVRVRGRGEALRGARSSYAGTELYLDLVDAAAAPWPADLAQLAVRALVSNRDLPLLLATGGSGIFQLADGGPVAEIATPVPPTRPRPGVQDGDTAWRLISQLSLNYLSLVDTEGGTAADALREMLGLHAPQGDRVLARQLEGILRVAARPCARRMVDEVLSTAVRGLEIELTCDESFFEGSSAYLLGAVLERFLARYVTMNSFTETVLRTETRGEVARWRPRAGKARLI